MQIARWQAGLRPVQGNRLNVMVAMGTAKRMKLFAAANDGEEEDEDRADGQEAPAAQSANADATSDRSSQPQERRFRGQRIVTPSRPGAQCQLAPLIFRARR